jgi:hypothetical protein
VTVRSVGCDGSGEQVTTSELEIRTVQQRPGPIDRTQPR